MPGEMNTNLKVEDLQMDVMITGDIPRKRGTGSRKC